MPVKTRNMVRMLSNSVKNFSTVGFDEIDINFDEASELWRQNKTALPNGCFKYKNETNPVGVRDRKCKKTVRYNL